MDIDAINNNFCKIADTIYTKQCYTCFLITGGCSLNVLSGAAEQLCRLIFKYYSNPNFDVNELTRLSGLSKPTITSYLRKEFQCTPNTMIQLCRISKALHLISTENYSITEIASRVGYTSIRGLENNFRIFWELTPSQIKEKLLMINSRNTQKKTIELLKLHAWSKILVKSS